MAGLGRGDLRQEKNKKIKLKYFIIKHYLPGIKSGNFMYLCNLNHQNNLLRKTVFFNKEGTGFWDE